MKNTEIAIGGISLKDQLILVKQMHAAIRAGYSVLEAIDLTLVQSKGRLKQVLGKIKDMVDNGAYLHEAFGKYSRYFPPIFLNLIKTGEMSGSLETNLDKLAGVISKDIEFKHKIRSAMTYPVFILIAILGLGISVALLILPNLLPLFKALGTDLPFTTRVLIGIAEFSQKAGFKFFGIFIALIVFLVFLLKKPFAHPLTHWLILRLPIFGPLVQKMSIIRLSQTIKSLLESGITIDRSVEISLEIITNYHYRRILRKALPILKKGGNLSDLAKSYPAYFDQMFVSILSLGEKTASLEDSFGYISDFYESDVDLRMKNLSVSLEPIMLIFVGIVVGFVALAILGPIYSLTGSIR